MESDLPELFRNYENYNNVIKKAIYSLAIENIYYIIDASISVSSVLKQKLLESNDLSDEFRFELCIAMIPELSEFELKELFEILNLPEYLKIFESRTRPKFIISSTNERLLSVLKESHWIKTYEEDENREGYYKISRGKMKK